MKNSTLLYIGGCSGTSNPGCARYRCEFGINTTSLAVINGHTGYLIDNGSGVANSATFLMRKNPAYTYGLQTHYHLDHTCGLPTNPLLFTKGALTKIFAPKLGEDGFEQTMNTIFKKQTWPTSPGMFSVVHNISSFTPGENLGDAWVKTLPTPHPEGSVAYRILLPEGDLVTATDCELSTDASIQAMATFVTGAKLLYLDVQYRDCEYEGMVAIGSDTKPISRIGWGHSTPSMLRKLIEASKALPNGMPKKVLIGHHDPKHTDLDLKAFENEVAEYLADIHTNVSFAREGDTYVIA